MKNGNDGLIEALYEREKALRERIAQAKADRQRQIARQRAELAKIIGTVLIDADIPPAVKSSIMAILAAAGLEDRAKRFLEVHGWVAL